MAIAMNTSRKMPFIMSKNEANRKRDEEEARCYDDEQVVGEDQHPFTPSRRGRRRKSRQVRTFTSMLKGLTDILEQAKGKVEELEHWHKDWETRRMVEDVHHAGVAASPDPSPGLSPAGFSPAPPAARRIVTFDVDEVPAERRPGDSADVKAAIPMESVGSFQPFEAVMTDGADSNVEERSVPLDALLSGASKGKGVAAQTSFRDHAPTRLLPVESVPPANNIVVDPAASSGTYTPPGLARLSVSSICMVPIDGSNGDVAKAASQASLGTRTNTSDGGSIHQHVDSKGENGQATKQPSKDEAPKSSLTARAMEKHDEAQGAEDGNDLGSETVKSDSSSSGEEEQAGLRHQWEVFDVQAIIKYEKELQIQEHRMKRASSKMSPASVGQDIQQAKRGFFRWRTRSTTSRGSIGSNPEPIVPSLSPLDEDITSGISKKSLTSEVTTFQALHRHSSFHKIEKRFNLVCHPQGLQRLFWDIASIVLISYDLITLPMYAFAFQSTPRLDLLEWGCTVFWTVDIFMSFRTGYYRGHRLEMDLQQIAKHYTKTWFFIDICIVVPEWIARTLDWVIEGLNAARIGRVSRFVRFVRLMRIIKMGHFTDKIEEILGNNMMLLGFSLTKLSIILGLCVHFLTCIWYGIGSSGNGSWVANEDIQNESLLAKYVAAARWTLAQINGRTDQVMDRTMAEKGYTVACAFFTVLFMSIFVSTLTTRMMELQKLMDEETRYTKMLMNYLEHKKVSFSVSYLAKMYVKNNKRMQSEQETEKSLMAILPRSLKADLLYEVRSPMLAYHSFFADIKADFQKVTRVLCSEAVILVPATTAEVTFQKDEECDRMYIVERGDMRYAEHANLTHHVAKMKNAAQGRSRKSVFSGVDRATSAVVGGMLGSGNRPEDVAAHIPGIPVQNEGTLICEGALWTEWRTRGELIAVSMSMLMAVKCETFTKIMCSVKDTQCRAARYARLFHYYIAQMDYSDVSDLTVMKLAELPTAGQRISLLANQAKWA